MSDILKNIYDGSLYLYALCLIASALYILTLSVIEAHTGNYGACLLGLMASGLCCGIVYVIITRLMTVQSNGDQ